MSNSVSLSAIDKIHINNSTKMTLSDRFTAFSAQPKIQPRTSRRSGIDSPVSRAASIANRRLLKQLAHKHTREAALKLKRRSMKPRAPTAAYTRVSNGVPLKRGSIKALRLGPSGRLMKANSITNVATMEADFLGRPPRRSNSTSRISERIGARRLGEAPNGGTIARRVGGRPAWRTNSQTNFERTPPPPRMRSRSRSRTRRAGVLPSQQQQPGGIGQRIVARPGRSNSRPRALIRSRSRSGRVDRLRRMLDNRSSAGTQSVPITSRLGRRPNAPPPNRARSSSRGGRRPLREGVASGRIQKQRNSVKAVTARGASLAGSVQNRISRARARYDPQRSAPPANSRLNAQFPKPRGNASRGRARSRSRADNRSLQRNNGTAVRGNNRQQRGGGGQQSARGRGIARGNGRRGRSQQRGAGGAAQRNGGGPQQQQQRRGRSRSRGRGSARGGRQLGKDKPDVKKEDLDKELDQYMSSTKTTDGLFS